VRIRTLFIRAGASGLLALACALPARALIKKQPTTEQLRSAYIARLEQSNATPAEARTTGSLWNAAAPLNDLSSDYKAHNLYDTVVVLVSVQTTAAQSGDVDSERAFTTTSGITGLVGGIATHGTNPLLNANSDTTLKGTGQTDSNTTFSTSLTGQVIAVLPNGYLVIEAQRKIFMNNQHENVIIRGVARPGDISTANTIPSTSLSDLEIELKGKGIISDSVRPPNFLTKALLWLFGF
jgi:flagellar L-ring protein precursor FlgH